MNKPGMNLTWSMTPSRAIETDLIAAFLPQDAVLFRTAMKDIQRIFKVSVTEAIRCGDFSGKAGETLVLYPAGSSRIGRVLFVGMGERRRWSLESYRRAAAAAARKALSLKSRSITLWLPPALPVSAETCTAFAEGAWLAAYRFDKYVTPPQQDRTSPLEHIHIATDQQKWKRILPAAIDHARIICEATTLARDLANAPACEIYPETLANAAVESGERCGYDVDVWTEAELAEKGMGGILAVGQGSVRPPRFMILTYGHSSRPPLILVGKGVCFDSGGISIKPAAGMAEMKMDMSGAAAVIGTFEAVARLQLPVHLVGLIPAVENMPGGKALKPGDIIRHFGGRTSEVDNTDAEGRLILADALAYAVTLKPASIIDLATLTGAVVVALGHVATGMFGTNTSLMEGLRRAGEQTHERVWQLPLFEEYEKLIKSDIADVKNVGGRWAGAITGALFLKSFVGKTPWVHLDIAGTAMLEETRDYLPKGASGVGVRLLTEFIRRKR